MGYEGGDLLLAGAALAGVGPLRGACIHCAEHVDAGCGLTGLAAQFSHGKRVRDVYTCYALYKVSPLPSP